MKSALKNTKTIVDSDLNGKLEEFQLDNQGRKLLMQVEKDIRKNFKVKFRLVNGTEEIVDTRRNNPFGILQGKYVII